MLTNLRSATGEDSFEWREKSFQRHQNANGCQVAQSAWCVILSKDRTSPCHVCLSLRRSFGDNSQETDHTAEPSQGRSSDGRASSGASHLNSASQNAQHQRHLSIRKCCPIHPLCRLCRAKATYAHVESNYGERVENAGGLPRVLGRSYSVSAGVDTLGVVQVFGWSVRLSVI